MAPQLENGYTRIANEILEKLAATKLNGTQFRIVLVVLRYTYGFKRKEHKFSETFLANATGIHKQQIKRELKELICQDILRVTQEATFSTPRFITFNKCYQVANPLPGIKNDTPTGSGLDTPPGSGLDTQERKNLKKESKDIYIGEFEELWERYPNRKGKAKAQKSFVKLREKLSLEELTRTVARYAEEVNGKDKQYIKHGSTFFNSGYTDYLDKNYRPLNEQTTKHSNNDVVYIDGSPYRI